MRKLKLKKIKRKQKWKIRKKLKKLKKLKNKSKRKKIFIRFKGLLKLEKKFKKNKLLINSKKVNFINVFDNLLFISFLRKIFTSTIKNGKKGKSLKLADNCIICCKFFLKNKNFLNIMYFVFKNLQPIICDRFFFQGRRMVIIPGLFSVSKFDNKKIKFCVRLFLNSISKRNEKKYFNRFFNEIFDIFNLKKNNTFFKKEEIYKNYFLNKSNLRFLKYNKKRRSKR